MEKAVPGPSNVSPPRKNHCGKFVGSAQKTMIINLYKSIMLEQPEMKYKPLVERLSRLTGIGQTTIIKTLAEYKATGDVTSPNKKKRRLNILEKTSDADVIAIRKKVYEFWFKNEIPNVKKVLEAINSDEALPSFSESTLYRLLKRMEFKSVGRSRNTALIDLPYIVCWRQKYIRKIRELRTEGRPIYYLGETWVNVADCRRKLSLDTSASCPGNTEQRAPSTGIPDPSGKRLIIAHVGSADGFLPGALLCFEAKKNSDDYRNEINGDTFFEWFRSFSPMLKDGAVIVMDNASYHSEQLENYPLMHWKRPDIVAWLEAKGEKVEARFVKVQLMKLVEKYKQPQNYVIDKFATANGHTVLRLPPFHCELNPIDLAWAKIQTYVRGRNATYAVADNRQLVHEAVENVSAEMWKDFIRRSTEEEQRFYELDRLTDSLLEESGEWSDTSTDSDFHM